MATLLISGCLLWLLMQQPQKATALDDGGEKGVGCDEAETLRMDVDWLTLMFVG